MSKFEIPHFQQFEDYTAKSYQSWVLLRGLVEMSQLCPQLSNLSLYFKVFHPFRRAMVYFQKDLKKCMKFLDLFSLGNGLLENRP